MTLGSVIALIKALGGGSGGGGSGGGTTLVHPVNNWESLDMTAGGLYEAALQGTVLLFSPKQGVNDGGIYALVSAWDAGDGYWFYFFYPDIEGNMITYRSETANDYPTAFMPNG